ncbi:MAG: AAA family ATPase [Myxococcota bacterium]
MDHLNHHGLEREPFSNAPVGRFYFDCEDHRQAVLRLNHTLRSMRGLALVVGEIGAGKTTLARRLLDALPEHEFEAALLVVIHRDVTPDWLLRRLAVQLGVEQPHADKLALLSQLYRRLGALHEQGKKAVVLVDEAQMLATRELMEEFRGLLNLEVPERKLLSFVFFGLPELEQNLKLDPPLAQRVAQVVRLGPMDLETMLAYVEHRMRLAGARRDIIPEESLRMAHYASRGFPRVVNTVCDNFLLESALVGQSTVTPDLARVVIRNLGLPLLEQAPVPTTQKLPVLRGEPLGLTDPPVDAETARALEEIDRILASFDEA